MERNIIETADGSKTLYLPEMNEQYHSVNGAVTESNYVYLEKGFIFHQKPEPVVFEVGFGTGLNSLLTAVQAEKLKRKTTYFTIEKFPLEDELISKLKYGEFISEGAISLFNKIHACEWNKTVQISPFFLIHKIKAGLIEFNFEKDTLFDIIYFDAFGPDKQPEMWSPEIFQKIYNQCSPGAVFVTYSAKGEIRRQLGRTGFEMERLPGPPGKKQMLRGIKKISSD